MSESKTNILVVDDHADNLDMLTRRLVRRGYFVRTAKSGAEALELLDREDIDLVVLDVMMPEMSGLEVLEKVRETTTPEELPVIMATAKGDSADIVRALDLGANDYVVKPIDIDVLLARMRVHLRNAPAAPARVEPGDIGPGFVLDRKYELLDRIGSGGFGTVFRATHRSLQKSVAVKVLHPHLLASQRAVRRFAREGVSACRVQHPNAVAILDAGTSLEGLPYLVMELLEGRSLAEELELHGAMRLARCARIMVALCAALEAAHAEGIVHRDVKPANVFLSTNVHGVESVKVLDFGIAKLVEAHDGGPPTLDELAGTPQYMAPERLLGEPCDWRSDVYSVGVTAFEMLTGAYPYSYRSNNALAQAMQQVRDLPRSLGDLRVDLPARVVQIVMAALARDPSVRPELSELAAVLVRSSSDWEEKEWPLRSEEMVSGFEPTMMNAPRRVPEDAVTRDESGLARKTDEETQPDDVDEANES